MDPNAAPTVRIKYPANLRVGYCQIPAGEFNPAVHELWGNGPDAAERRAASTIGTDSVDQFSDEQLRASIESATGERPHHRTGREKLVAMFNELNKDA